MMNCSRIILRDLDQLLELGLLRRGGIGRVARHEILLEESLLWYF